MLQRGLNSPWTTSAGRLFDVVASLLGVCQRSTFEGQAALQLELACDEDPAHPPLPFQIRPAAPEEELLEIDWEPMLVELIQQQARGAGVPELATRFHRTLADVIVAVARRVGEPRVVLSGGCFQNRCLTEGAARRLEEAGFRCYSPQRVPPGDGGLAVGQALVAAHRLEEDA